MSGMRRMCIALLAFGSILLFVSSRVGAGATNDEQRLRSLFQQREEKLERLVQGQEIKKTEGSGNWIDVFTAKRALLDARLETEKSAAKRLELWRAHLEMLKKGEEAWHYALSTGSHQNCSAAYPRG